MNRKHTSSAPETDHVDRTGSKRNRMTDVADPQRRTARSPADLPPELLSATLDHLDFPSARSLLEGICMRSAAIREFMDERRNLTRYLGRLVDAPAVLRRIMRPTRVIIVLSRAVDFHSPGSCARGADWDFAADHDKDNRALIRFLAATTRELGFSWQVYGYRIDFPDVLRFVGTVSRRDGTVHRVSLEVRSGFRAWQTVLDFHLSPTRCFIAADVAVHMYRSDLHARRMRVWRIQGWLYERMQSIHARSQCAVCRAFRSAATALDRADIKAMRAAYRRSMVGAEACPPTHGLVAEVLPMQDQERGQDEAIASGNEGHVTTESGPWNERTSGGSAMERLLRPIRGVRHQCKDFTTFCRHVEKYRDRGYALNMDADPATTERAFEERYIGDDQCLVTCSADQAKDARTAFRRRLMGPWRDCRWRETDALSLIMSADGRRTIG